MRYIHQSRKECYSESSKHLYRAHYIGTEELLSSQDITGNISANIKLEESRDKKLIVTKYNITRLYHITKETSIFRIDPSSNVLSSCPPKLKAEKTKNIGSIIDNIKFLISIILGANYNSQYDCRDITTDIHEMVVKMIVHYIACWLMAGKNKYNIITALDAVKLAIIILKVDVGVCDIDEFMGDPKKVNHIRYVYFDTYNFAQCAFYKIINHGSNDYYTLQKIFSVCSAFSTFDIDNDSICDEE